MKRILFLAPLLLAACGDKTEPAPTNNTVFVPPNECAGNRCTDPKLPQD